MKILMKYCPACQTTYADDSLLFCLQDGTALVSRLSESSHNRAQDFGESETVVRQNQIPPYWEQSQATFQPEAKKSNTPLTIILTALAMCVFFGGVVGAWLLLSGGDSEFKDSSGILTNNIYNSPSPIPILTMPPNTNTGKRIQNKTINSGINIGENGQFIGCFKDTNDFDLNGYLEPSRSNTPQNCIETCRRKGFKYAGVQDGKSCLCGNSYGRYGAADNCNTKCTGDGNQICGGSYANSVWKVK